MCFNSAQSTAIMRVCFCTTALITMNLVNFLSIHTGLHACEFLLIILRWENLPLSSSSPFSSSNLEWVIIAHIKVPDE